MFPQDVHDQFDETCARVITARIAKIGGAYIQPEAHPLHGDTVHRVRWPDGTEEARYSVAILQRIQDIEEGVPALIKPHSLRAALRRYGRHDEGCVGSYGGTCTCGFFDALAHHVVPEEKVEGNRNGNER